MLMPRADLVLDHHAQLGTARMLAPPGRAPCRTRHCDTRRRARSWQSGTVRLHVNWQAHMHIRHCKSSSPLASQAVTHTVLRRRRHWMAGTAGRPHQQAHRRRRRGRHGLRQRAAGRLFRLRTARRRGCAARPVARLRARRRRRAGRQRAGRVRRGGRRGAAHDARRKRPRRGDRVRLGQVEELVRRQDQTAAAAHPAGAARARCGPAGAAWRLEAPAFTGSGVVNAT